MNYWANGDALFEDGHYVEDWELVRYGELSDSVRQLLKQEALKGNKIRAIGKRYVCLSHPPLSTVDQLPADLAFVCPVYFDAKVFRYDGAEFGQLMDVTTGDFVEPSWPIGSEDDIV